MKNQMFSLNSNVRSGIVIIISLGLLGCGATKSLNLKEAYEIQKPIVVRTSLDDDRPQWTQNTVFELNGKIYFTGGFTDGADYAVVDSVCKCRSPKISCSINLAVYQGGV